jgi:hypothetical protein
VTCCEESGRHDRIHCVADDLRAERVRRRRGDQQGLLDAAHPADVGGERDPRRHPGRRDHFVVTDRMLEMFRGRRKPTVPKEIGQ